MSRKKAELDKARVAALYEDGNTTEQISKVFGVTAPTIRNFMKEHGIAVHSSRRRLTKDQIEQAATMRSSGMTLKQIADTFNVGYTCIHNSLKTDDEKKAVPTNTDTIIDTNYLGYNPTQLKRKRTQNSTDLNLYIPEKWY